MAFKTRIFRYLDNVFLMAIGAIPDPVRVLPFMMALVAVYTRFLMGFMDDIHLVFSALRGYDSRQLSHIGGALFFTGNKQGRDQSGNDAAYKEVCFVHYGCCSLIFFLHYRATYLKPARVTITKQLQSFKLMNSDHATFVVTHVNRFFWKCR